VDPRQVEEKLAERTSGTLAASVSRAVVRLMHEFTGRGPTRARAIMNANSVLVLLEDTLTRAELNLLGACESEAVVTMRRTYFAAMREQASATVAEITGRGVISMMADLDPDANMAVVFFAPRARSRGRRRGLYGRRPYGLRGRRLGLRGRRVGLRGRRRVRRSVGVGEQVVDAGQAQDAIDLRRGRAITSSRPCSAARRPAASRQAIPSESMN
jgi:uncharacterized protein YbcI